MLDMIYRKRDGVNVFLYLLFIGRFFTLNESSLQNYKYILDIYDSLDYDIKQENIHVKYAIQKTEVNIL